MSRAVLSLLFSALFVFAGVLHQFSSAQPAAVEVPVVASPTYIAVPPPQQEVMSESPSPQYVWVSGHWNRTPDSWSWSAGQWVQPPFSNAYWIPGYWQHQGGQYVWETAHWAATDQGVIAEKPVTAPPVYEEVQPAAPVGSQGLVWQPGHWEWRGGWFWIAGTYIQTTIANTVWVPGQWVTGADGLWRWSPAHWAYA
jgi:hypothetical protein